MREFVENVHLNRKDINEDNYKFREYMQCKYQSKAFPLSFILATSAVFIFYNCNKLSSRLISNFYAINLFFATQILTYEIISKNFANRNKLATLDTYSYLNEKS